MGSTKTVVVHRNRLKRCYGLPKEGKGQNRRANPVPKQTDEASRPSKPQENLAFEDYAVHAESGCCVDADDEPDADNVQMARPQRNRSPLIATGFMLNTKILQGCKKLGGEYCNNVVL